MGPITLIGTDQTDHCANANALNESHDKHLNDQRHVFSYVSAKHECENKRQP